MRRTLRNYLLRVALWIDVYTDRRGFIRLLQNNGFLIDPHGPSSSRRQLYRYACKLIIDND